MPVEIDVCVSLFLYVRRDREEAYVGVDFFLHIVKTIGFHTRSNINKA